MSKPTESELNAQAEEILSEFDFHAVLRFKEKMDEPQTTCKKLRETLCGLLEDYIKVYLEREAVSISTGGFIVKMSWDWNGEDPTLEAIYRKEVESCLAHPKEDRKWMK